MIRLTMVAISILAFSACAPPSGSEDGTEIARLSDSWEAALNAGDVGALVALYTEDARVMGPNEPIGTGLEAARAAFAAMIDAGLSGELTTVDSRIAGDIGYNVGTYTLNTADGSLADRGKFVEIWRRRDGEWRIAHDIWNSDLPPAAAASGDAATMVITHQVRDPDRWLAAWQNGRRELFEQHGASHVHVYQNPVSPNLTALVVGMADPRALQAFLESPAAESAKAEDGVVNESLLVFNEVH